MTFRLWFMAVPGAVTYCMRTYVTNGFYKMLLNSLLIVQNGCHLICEDEDFLIRDFSVVSDVIHPKQSIGSM